MSSISIKLATSVAIIGGLVAGAVSASAALNLPKMSCSYMFDTNVKMGSRGATVMDLQKVLNMYPQTQVAFAPNPGSPGMETSTFGPVTRRAVNVTTCYNRSRICDTSVSVIKVYVNESSIS